MKEYCFRGDPKRGIFNDLLVQTKGLIELPEPEGGQPFDREEELKAEMDAAREDIEGELGSLGGIKDAAQALGLPDPFELWEPISKQVLSLLSDALLFASLLTGVWWGYSANKGAQLSLSNENANCWFMQTIAFPFTVPLIIPIVKIFIKLYNRLAYVLPGEKSTAKERVTSLSNSYFKVEARVEKYREQNGEQPALIKMIPVTWWEILIFGYLQAANSKQLPFRLLPQLPASFTTKRRWQVISDTKADKTTGHSTQEVVNNLPELPKRKKRMRVLEKMERYFVACVVLVWGLVLSVYTLPLFLVFFIGALAPTLLNQIVLVSYSTAVLYSAVILVEIFVESLYQLVMGIPLACTEDFYIRDKFMRSRPLYLLLPVFMVLMVLLTVPPALIMGQFFFLPLDESTEKYKNVTTALMNFNNNLWQWKTLFNVGFPFPDLENFFQIEFWEGMKFADTMAFVLGILATIVDVFADLGLPVAFSVLRLCVRPSFHGGISAVAASKDSMKNLKKAQKLVNNKHVKLLGLYAKRLRDQSVRGTKKPVKFDDMESSLKVGAK